MEREEILSVSAEEELAAPEVVKAFSGMYQRHLNELGSIHKALEEITTVLRNLQAAGPAPAVAPEALPDRGIRMEWDETTKSAVRMIVNHKVRTSARLFEGLPIKSLVGEMLTRKATWQFGGATGLDELRTPTLWGPAITPMPPINLGAMLLGSDIAQEVSPPVEIPIIRDFGTGGAAITEGGSGAEMGLPIVDRRTLTKEIISAYVPITAHLMEQSNFIVQFIRQNLVYEITRQVERHVLGVSGSPIQGILQAGISTNSQNRDASNVATELDTDTILESIGNVASRGFQPNLIVVLGQTWYGRIKKQKTTTREYILGSPLESAEPETLWGIPVLPVYTDVLTSTQVLVGEFSVRTLFMPIFENLDVVASSEHADLFVRHMVAIRGSIALNFAVLFPGAFELVDLAPTPLS